MKTRITFLFSLMWLFSLGLTAQTANVQIIHNSANPTVDIWVNDEPFLTDFAYRTATPFVEVPAGVQLSIGVAPAPSSDPSEIIASFDVQFEEGNSYIVIATGLVGDPDTPFDLLVVENARQTALSGDVEFIVNHGSTDAPAVDVIARDVATLVDNAAYPAVTDYIQVPADSYILDITPADDNSQIVASYEADLSTLGGMTATVIASGFLNPGVNQPAFGLIAVLADGSVLQLPAVVNTARLQIIHNSPTPTVDIWVNDQPFLTNFEYRSATPFVDVPAGQTLNIGVAPAPSSDPSEIIATFPVTFAPNSTSVAIATGIVGDMDTPFTLALKSDARESGSQGNVEFFAFHGSTDAPAVDVIARGVATLVDNAAYGDLTDYITVPANDYILDVTLADDNQTIVASFAAPLSGLEGGSAAVFASGFLSPSGNDPAFGLFAALADGTVIALPAVQNTARLQIIHNSPSPTVDIWVNNEPFLTGFEFRTATPFVDVPAGQTLNIGVAPFPSSDPSEIIATFPVNFTPNSTSVAIATGIVGDAETPFTLALNSDARESAVSDDVEFFVYHGSTDAPAVDVIARGVATIVDNAAYGDITDYITVPANDYTLDITPAEDNETIVASFSAPLSGLAGGSAVVFASGFLSPGANDPGFGLFAALADGTVLALPSVQNTARLQIIHNSPSPTVDIWVNDEPFLTNFEFRTATPFVDVPAGQTLNIGVAPAPSSDPSEIIASFPVNFAPNSTNVAIATGIVGDMDTPFTLALRTEARESASSNDVEFFVYHGSTDAPAVDVIARGVATLVDNAAYGDVTDYITVPANAYTLDVTPAEDNSTIVASYTADLSGLGGGSAVVFASGFLNPPTNDDPAFGIYVTLADGTTFALPIATSTEDPAVPSGSINLYPNPASGTVYLDFESSDQRNLRISVLDINGQVVFSQDLGTQQAGSYTETLPVSDMSPGSYIMTLKSDRGITSKVLLKQ